MPIILLAPAPGEKPHSSLGWMLDVIRRRWGASNSGFFIQRGHVDDWRLFRLLKQQESEGRPIALLGTTLGFLALFDQCARQQVIFRCAPGSRVMDTGGMKMENRSVSRRQFLDQVKAYLGIQEEFCVNEYGMCELSSQYYARGESMVFQGPPWMRSVVRDPMTGAILPTGKTGLLRHFDLANVDSVLAIDTEDEGMLCETGIELKGRAASAPVKGCSIDLETYLRRS